MKTEIYKPHATESFSYDALEQCPFCGNEPVLKFKGNDFCKKREVVIKCPSCRITLTNAALRMNSKDLAIHSINSWNKRINQ